MNLTNPKNHTANVKSICVLIVDDDVDWLTLMQIWLKREGLNVVVSVNAEDIWEKIEDCRPKVILLDIQLNGVNGENICRQLKTNPPTEHIPVLMYSSNRNIDAIARICGADGHIEKGLTPKMVKDRLMEYVRED